MSSSSLVFGFSGDERLICRVTGSWLARAIEGGGRGRVGVEVFEEAGCGSGLGVDGAPRPRDGGGAFDVVTAVGDAGETEAGTGGPASRVFLTSSPAAPLFTLDYEITRLALGNSSGKLFMVWADSGASD